jgi:inner membrane protein
MYPLPGNPHPVVLLWHIGASTAFTRYAFRDQAMDLRFLALGAVLPDLVDLPIGIIGWSTWQTPRLFAHSLLFGSALMVVVLLATRRGPTRKRFMLVAVGVLLHLALDAMWNSPETLWWPFLGTEFTLTAFATYGVYVGDLFRSPKVYVGEVSGLVYMAFLWHRSHLGESAARKKLLSTGTVSAPIGRG